MNIKKHFSWGAFLEGTYYVKPLTPLGKNFLENIVTPQFRLPENYDIDGQTLMLANQQLADHVIDAIENMEVDFSFTID